MYDALRATYRMRCPEGEGGGATVRLSGFQSVTRLDGPSHPAVYRIVYTCAACGGDHVALMTHEELDYAPFEAPAEVAFWDPLTGRIGGDLGRELLEAAADRVRRGVWPWSFWCSAEARMRPGYPSALRYVGGRDGLYGAAVSCASCGHTSLNLVSGRHLDEPFFHDRVVGALERPLGEIDEIERFRAELWSGRFDGHRTDLAA